MLAEVKQLSVKEFRELEFDENDNAYYELINGIIIKKSTPTPQHQKKSMSLSLQLGSFIKLKKSGELFAAPVDLFLDDHNAVQPDLVFVANGNQRIVTTDGIMGIPDLIVEIISPSSVMRDRVDKKNLYEKLNEDIEIYTILNGRYELLSGVTMLEGSLKSNILDGISIDLKELFE